MTSPPVNPPSFPMKIETYHEIGFRHVVGTLTLTDEALHFQQDFNEDTHEQEEIDLSAVTQAEHQHSNGTTHKTDELMRRSWEWSSIKKFKVIDSTLSENKKMIQLTKFHNKNTVISLTVNDDDNLLKIVNGMGIRLTIVHNKLQQLKEQEKKLKHQRASLSQSENLHLRSSAASVGSNKSKESHTGSQYSRGSLKKKATISPLSMSQSENHHSRTRTSKQSSNKNQDHSKLSPLSMSQSDNQHNRTARHSREKNRRSNGTPPRPSRTSRARKERDSTSSLPPLQAIDITPPHDPSSASPKSQGSSPDDATRKLRRPSNLLTPKFPLLRPPPAHDHRRLQKQTSVPALMGRSSLIGHSNDHNNSTGSNEGENDASKVPATPPATRRGLLGGSGRAFSSRLLSGGGKQLSSRLLLGGRQTSTRDIMTVTEASPRTTTANITEDILPATTTTGSSSNAATRKKMPLLHFLKKPPSRRHLGGDGSMNEDWTERSHSQSQTNNNNFHESFSKISTPPIAE